MIEVKQSTSTGGMWLGKIKSGREIVYLFIDEKRDDSLFRNRKELVEGLTKKAKSIELVDTESILRQRWLLNWADRFDTPKENRLLRVAFKRSSIVPKPSTEAGQ